MFYSACVLIEHLYTICKRHDDDSNDLNLCFQVVFLYFEKMSKEDLQKHSEFLLRRCNLMFVEPTWINGQGSDV